MYGDSLETITIRPANPADLSFIYSTMLKSLRFDSEIGKSVRSNVFFREYRLVLDQILLNSETLIACDQQDPEVIYAYLIYKLPDVIEYAFTKQAFRNLGLQNKLYKSSGLCKELFATHKTETAQRIMLNKEIEYNPFLNWRQ